MHAPALLACLCWCPAGLPSPANFCCLLLLLLQLPSKEVGRLVSRLESVEARLAGHQLWGSPRLLPALVALQHKQALAAAARTAKKELKAAHVRRGHSAGRMLLSRCWAGCQVVQLQCELRHPHLHTLVTITWCNVPMRPALAVQVPRQVPLSLPPFAVCCWLCVFRALCWLMS